MEDAGVRAVWDGVVPVLHAAIGGAAGQRGVHRKEYAAIVRLLAGARGSFPQNAYRSEVASSPALLELLLRFAGRAGSWGERQAGDAVEHGALLRREHVLKAR